MMPLSSKNKLGNQFLKYINCMDPHIQFTIENARPDGSIPFLAPLVMSEPDRTLPTTMYRKLTPMDEYLHWDSHHNHSAMYGVFNTLTYGSETPYLTHNYNKRRKNI